MQGRMSGLTQIMGHMKRCRPALDGQSNSKRMEPFALHAWSAINRHRLRKWGRSGWGPGTHPPLLGRKGFHVAASWKAKRSARPVTVGLMLASMALNMATNVWS